MGASSLRIAKIACGPIDLFLLSLHSRKTSKFRISTNVPFKIAFVKNFAVPTCHFMIISSLFLSQNPGYG